MSKINPAILKWAREDAAFDLLEAAKKLGFKDTSKSTAIEKLILIENGDEEPSKSTLEKMVLTYRKPLLVFYASDIPLQPSITTDYRKTDSTITAQEEFWLRTLVSDVAVRQYILSDVYSEFDDIDTIPFIGSVSASMNSEDIKSHFIKVTNFNLNRFRECPDETNAFNYAREVIEKTGVFVVLIGNLGSYHTGLSTEVYRGFTIANEYAPFIAINPNDAKGSLVFDLFHEFIHLMLGQSSISNGNLSINVEKLCDEVVGSIILSRKDLESLKIHQGDSFEEIIKKIAYAKECFNVSYTSIAYNLFKYRLVDRSVYLELEDYYSSKYFEYRKHQKESSSGGPKYKILKNYQNGKLLTSTVGELLHLGALSVKSASKVLGTKQSSVYSLVTR